MPIVIDEEIQFNLNKSVADLSKPNRTESHPVIDTQESSLIVSEVVFNKLCFIESQEVSLITTEGVGVFISVFEQE